MAAIVNRAAGIRVDRIGVEEQPVMVIDDVLADPDRWRRDAASADFRPIGPHYPGVRSPIAPALANGLRDALAWPIAATFSMAAAPPLGEAYFSIVTVAPQALRPIQRLPHFDGLERERIAILIYLSRAEQGGTAFYRQRATGFETVDRSRFAAYDDALKAGVRAHGLPAPAYIAGDTPLFESIACYEARPKRALVYRSHALHCAAITPGAPLPADPETGRLSLNLFLLPGPTPPAS